MAAGKHAHDCANCPTRHTSDWRALTESELELINSSKHTRVYEAGEALYHQGDEAMGVHCIQSGLIGLRRLDAHGNSILLRLAPGGATVGYRAFLTKSEHRLTAEVLTPSVVCFIAKSLVSRLLGENPLLGERFLQHCLSDMDDVESDYARSLTHGLKARFLHVMVVFYERLGYRDDTGRQTMDLPVRRTEIAELIGAQPESVSRMIRDLQNEGVLEFDKRRVVFRDMDRVLDDIGAGPDIGRG